MCRSASQASWPIRLLLLVVVGLLSTIAHGGLADARGLLTTPAANSQHLQLGNIDTASMRTTFAAKARTAASHSHDAPDRMRRSRTRRGPARRATKAGRGGAGPVRVGQAGEDAVRGAYDIGPKATRVINGRTRIFDGLTVDAVSEVKNVARLSYTRQLRDSAEYASAENLRFDLYVRPGARLSGPLLDAKAAGRINIQEIPR